MLSKQKILTVQLYVDVIFYVQNIIVVSVISTTDINSQCEFRKHYFHQFTLLSVVFFENKIFIVLHFETAVCCAVR